MADDITGLLLEELTSITSPLIEIVDADTPQVTLRRFLHSCGWTVTAAVDPAPIVSAADGVITAVTDALAQPIPDDLGELAERLAAIAALIDSLRGIAGVIADGGPATPTVDEIGALGEDVLHRLVTRWMRSKPLVYEIALAIGLVEMVDLPALTVGGWLERRAATQPRVRPEVIVDFVSDPVGTALDVVAPGRWAETDEAVATNLFITGLFDPLLARYGGRWHPHPDAFLDSDVARQSMLHVRAPVADGAGSISTGAEIEMYSAQDTNDDGDAGPAVEIAPFGRYEASFAAGEWMFTILVAMALGGVDAGDSAPGIRIDAGGLDVVPNLDTDVQLGATVPVGLRFGGSGTRVDLGELVINLFTESRGPELDFGFSVLAAGSSITFSSADLGAAVDSVAAFENTLAFELGLAWSRNGGLTLAGAASLEFVFTEGIDIGGVVALSGIRLRLDVADTIAFQALTDAAINLGPVALAFEQTGVGLELAFPDGGGNLGAADLSLAVAFPKGIGVRVDAGVVRGGGYLYFDPEGGEYAGVLELSFPALSLSLKAVGMFSTNLPDGASGYALLLLIFAEFPAIQLGYGFTLNGVGGILGLQHGISTDALQDGLRTGALDSVLFPDDPVANAPSLLNDLRAIFPVTPGALTFGPVLQLGWGAGIITISLGLVLQFDDVIGSGAGEPSIARIVLLGQLKIELPPVDDAPELVKLLIDIVGYYDFEEQELGVDAMIRDSHIAGLPLTGSMTVRARFGDDPTFVLAVGGFHPRFTDIPPGIPDQDRLGVMLEYDIITVQIACYVAITSNSFQIGAEASLVAAAAGFRVEAYLGFDALFIFQPTFRFEIDFRVGAAIQWKDFNLASIRVSGRVIGPGRWEVTGSATFEVLFWDVDIDFDVAWGQSRGTELPPAAVLPQLVDAFSNLDNWSARLPDTDALVTLRQDSFDGVLAHPLSELEVRQKVVPFGITVDRVGETVPTDGEHFTLAGLDVGGVAQPTVTSQEHFARGDYLDLDEADKLSSPSFERFDAGATVGTDSYAIPTAELAFDPDYETVYLEQEEVREFGRLDGAFLYHQAARGAAAFSELRSRDRLIGDLQLDLAVHPPAFAVADATTLDIAPDFELVDGVALQHDAGRSLSFTEATQAAAVGGGTLVESIEIGGPR